MPPVKVKLTDPVAMFEHNKFTCVSEILNAAVGCEITKPKYFFAPPASVTVIE